MKRTTEWRPNTCDCIMQFCWEDSSSEEDRVHTEKTIVALCPNHSSIRENDTAVATIENENITANKVIQEIASLSPILHTIIVNEDGTESFYPDLSKISVKYDDTRALHIALSGIDDAEKQQIQEAINAMGFDIVVYIR